MRISGGHSYSNGIDFTCEERGVFYVVSSRRNENGEVITKLTDHVEKTPRKRNKETLYAFFCFAVIVSVIQFYFKDRLDTFALTVSLLLGIWCVMIGYCVLFAKDPENDSARKYHSVEHKILNFSTDEIEKDDNYKISADLDEVAEKVKKYSSYALNCGSTIMVVLMLFITLSVLGCMVLHKWYFDVLWIAVSILISFFFWASKYSFVLQKYTLLPPTDEEIQLGVFALQLISEKAEKIRERVPHDESYGIMTKDKEDGAYE